MSGNGTYGTGELRLRRGWRGRLILQGQIRYAVKHPAFGDDILRWEDIDATDLRDISRTRSRKKMEPFL